MFRPGNVIPRMGNPVNFSAWSVVCLIGAAQDELAETAALERKNKGIPDPPKELERALLFLEGGERPLRGDAIDLFINNPLPRFLLLACGK